MTPEERYFIHPEAYWKVIDFIEEDCTHTEGELARQPLKLPTWFKWQLRTIYGRYDRTTHRRAIKEFYIEVPKKNGKSTFISALSVYHLVADGHFTESGEWIPEYGPEVYCAAAARDQAKIIFKSSTWMVKQNPELLERIKCQQYELKRIGKPGSFRVLSSDAEGHEGLKISAAFIDEIHIHKKPDLYFTFKGGGAARLQPIIGMITTAGVLDPTAIGWQKHEYATKVINDWKFDPSFHGVIYSAKIEEEEDVFKEETWKAANPNYGLSVKKDFLEAKAREAKNDPTQLNFFKRYHLNIWVSSHSQWILKETYKKCNTIEAEDNTGERTWLGLDMGATDDLTALCRLYHKGKETRLVNFEGEQVEREEDIFAAELDTFCTSNKVDIVQNNSEHITYMRWVKNDWVRIMGDTDTDYVGIRKLIEKYIDKEYKVRSLTFDKFAAWETAVNLEQRYRSKGADFLRPINWNSFTCSPPMKKLQYLVNNGLIEFYHNPVLEWNFDNVMVMKDSKDNIFANKAKAKGKIDGVVALILAMDGFLNDKHKDRKKITEFTVI